MDLVRTGDADDQADGDSEDDGVVISKAKGALLFDDLVSDEELPPARVARKSAQEAAKWSFDTHDAEERGAVGGTSSALEDKIRERLESKLSKAEGKTKGKKAKAKSKKKAAKSATEVPREPASAAEFDTPEAPEGTPEHLRTNIHFADLRLSRPLLRACTELKFECPTPIQRDVIPPALKGTDILATAETGSGKTASFLLPTLERLCQSPSVRARRRDAAGKLIIGPVATKAVVMIPTRELAVQCHEMLKDLAKYTSVTYQLVAGGYVAQDQATSLRNQPDLVVATPGRLLDHLMNSHSVHMELLEIVVFDEADRLLEMGFRQECLEVLKRCSKGRQTMLFSATLNASVEDLAALALVKPERIHASPVNAVAQTLEQEFVKAPSEELREAALLSLVTRNYNSKVIVFCSTKEAAHRIAIVFGLCGLKFAEIHGNLSQTERATSLQRFQQSQAEFLIATDIASRGLDLPCTKTVINFHLPVDVTRYIHRVGRTARMGRTGRAVSIYTPEEYPKVKLLGRECSSKVQSKVVRRSIAAEAIQHWADKVASFEEDITAIIQEESVDKELRLADLLTQKSDNLEKHKKDIAARPAKEWFMSNKDKAKLKQSEKQSLQEAEAKALAGDDEEKESKKRKKGPLTEEELQEKRALRNRARLKAKREAEKAEREREQLRARASAKRSRRAQRDAEEFPLTIGERIFKQKMERRKKKGNKGKAAKKGKAR